MDKAVIVLLLCVQVSSSISDSCPNGIFGPDCQFQCHCIGGCEKDFKSCSTNCEVGWTGPTCQKANLPTKKVANIRNTASSQYPNGYANRAVDGDRTTCIHANATGSTERLRIELPSISQIRTIVISNTQKLSRGDRNWIKNLEIKVGSTTTISKARVCSRYPDKFPESGFASIQCVETGKYIWFIKKTSPYRFISLCEIEVYGEGCNPHTWGDNCGKFCGQCAGGANCDVETGKCPGDLCAEGWTGELCDQVEPGSTTSPTNSASRTVETITKTTVSQDVCQLEVDTGYECPFRPNFQWSFYFGSGVCFSSIYLGCGGNGNRFRTRSQCENKCISKAVTTPKVTTITTNDPTDATTTKQQSSDTMKPTIKMISDATTTKQQSSDTMKPTIKMISDDINIASTAVLETFQSNMSSVMPSGSVNYGSSINQMPTQSLSSYPHYETSDIKPTKSVIPVVSASYYQETPGPKLSTNVLKMSSYDMSMYDYSSQTVSLSMVTTDTYGGSFSISILDSSLSDSTPGFKDMYSLTITPTYNWLDYATSVENSKIFTLNSEWNQSASSYQMNDKSAEVSLSYATTASSFQMADRSSEITPNNGMSGIQSKDMESSYGTIFPVFTAKELPTMSTTMIPYLAATAIHSKISGDKYSYNGKIGDASIRTESSPSVDKTTAYIGFSNRANSKSTKMKQHYSSVVMDDWKASTPETEMKPTHSVNIVPTIMYTGLASSGIAPSGKSPDVSLSGKAPGERVTNTPLTNSELDHTVTDSSVSGKGQDGKDSDSSYTSTAVTDSINEMTSSSNNTIPIVLSASAGGLLLIVILIIVLMKKKSKSQKANLDPNLENFSYKDEKLDIDKEMKLTARDPAVQVPLLQINPTYDNGYDYQSNGKQFNGNMYHSIDNAPITNGNSHFTFNNVHQQNGVNHEESPANGTPYIEDDRFPNVRYIDL